MESDSMLYDCMKEYLIETKELKLIDKKGNDKSEIQTPFTDKIKDSMSENNDIIIFDPKKL